MAVTTEETLRTAVAASDPFSGLLAITSRPAHALVDLADLDIPGDPRDSQPTEPIPVTPAPPSPQSEFTPPARPPLALPSSGDRLVEPAELTVHSRPLTSEQSAELDLLQHSPRNLVASMKRDYVVETPAVEGPVVYDEETEAAIRAMQAWERQEARTLAEERGIPYVPPVEPEPELPPLIQRVETRPRYLRNVEPLNYAVFVSTYNRNLTKTEAPAIAGVPGVNLGLSDEVKRAEGRGEPDRLLSAKQWRTRVARAVRSVDISRDELDVAIVQLRKGPEDDLSGYTKDDARAIRESERKTIYRSFGKRFADAVDIIVDEKSEVRDLATRALFDEVVAKRAEFLTRIKQDATEERLWRRAGLVVLDLLTVHEGPVAGARAAKSFRTFVAHAKNVAHESNVAASIATEKALTAEEAARYAATTKDGTFVITDAPGTNSRGTGGRHLHL